MKLARENFYLNEILMNGFHLETLLVDSIDSNG